MNFARRLKLALDGDREAAKSIAENAQELMLLGDQEKAGICIALGLSPDLIDNRWSPDDPDAEFRVRMVEDDDCPW